jgi:hypothetical protein
MGRLPTPISVESIHAHVSEFRQLELELMMAQLFFPTFSPVLQLIMTSIQSEALELIPKLVGASGGLIDAFRCMTRSPSGRRFPQS